MPKNQLNVRLLKDRDVGAINRALAEAKNCKDVASFDELLRGVRYDSNFSIYPNELFKDRPGQRWHDHAIRGLIAYAPTGSLGADMRDKIERLRVRGEGYSGYSVFSVPLDLTPLSEMSNLRKLYLDRPDEVTGLDQLQQVEALEITYGTIPAQVTALPLTSLCISSAAGTLDLRQMSKTLHTIVFRNIRDGAVDIGGIAEMTALRHLTIEGCSITGIEELSSLRNLETLDLSRCTSLQQLPDLSNLHKLTEVNLKGCERLESLEGLRALTNIRSISLGRCRALTSVAPLAGNSKMMLQDLGWCTSLRSLEGVEQTATIDATWINLEHCTHLQNIDALASCTTLEALDLKKCASLGSIAPLAALTSLRWLNLSECPLLQSLSPLAGHSTLEALRLVNCSGLTSLEGLSGLTSLWRTIDEREDCNERTLAYKNFDKENTHLLDLSGLHKLPSLSGLELPPKTDKLRLDSARALTDIAVLSGCSHLRQLSLSGCDSLTSLRALVDLQNLSSVSLSGCRALKPRPKRVLLDTPAKIVGELDRHRPKKKATSRKSTKSKDVRTIRKLLQMRDYEHIHQGVELASALQDGDVFDALLEGVRVEGSGERTGQTFLPNKTFTGTGPAQPWLNYALWCLIAAAPAKSTVGSALQSQVKRLDGASFKAVDPSNHSPVSIAIPDLRCLANFPALEHLQIHHATQLTSLTGMGSLPALKTLSIEHCPHLENLQGPDQLPRLQEMTIKQCAALSTLSGPKALPALHQLTIEECKTLETVASLRDQGSPLSLVTMTNCPHLKRLDGMEAGAATLRRLHLNACSGLLSIEALASMTNLMELKLIGCSDLPSLKGLPAGDQITYLNLNGCMNLKEVDPLMTLTNLRWLGITKVHSENFDGFIQLVARLRDDGGMLLPADYMRMGRPISPAFQALTADKGILVIS